jgi:hypothetical protein
MDADELKQYLRIRNWLGFEKDGCVYRYDTVHGTLESAVYGIFYAIQRSDSLMKNVHEFLEDLYGR